MVRTAGRNGTEVIAVPVEPGRSGPLAEAATAYAATARAAGADVHQAVAALVAAYEHGYVVG